LKYPRNKLLETELLGKKTEVLSFLRSRLANYQLKFLTKVDENAREIRPYTDKEKLRKWPEKSFTSQIKGIALIWKLNIN